MQINISNAREHEIIELCLEAKKKGIDINFNYDANTEKIEVRIFKNGWKPNTDCDESFYYYMDWKDDANLGPVKALETTKHIKELLFSGDENKIMEDK